MNKVLSMLLIASLSIVHQVKAQNTYPWPSSGPIGIGTSTPASGYQLHVDGDIRFTWSSFNSHAIDFDCPHGEAGMRLLPGSGGRADVRFDGSTLKLVAHSSSSTPPASTNGISINTSGFVGINNDAPTYRLNVNDNSGNSIGSWVSANSEGPALWVRRDNSGTFTGTGSPYNTNLVRYAFLAENTDANNSTGGGIFIANNQGIRAEVNCSTPNGSASGVESFISGKGESPLDNAYGVYTTIDNSRYTTGVFSFADANESAIGIEAHGDINPSFCNNSNTTAYGIWAHASCGAITYAGYFSGAVFGTSFTTPSDAKLKKNIAPLQNPLDVLSKLQPKTYEFVQSDEFLGLELEKGKKYGFIEQELETILPELVKDVHNPEIKNKEGKLLSKSFDFKGIDYISLIPILVGGINEQQQEIDLKSKEIKELQEQLKELKAMVGALTKQVNCISSTPSADNTSDKAMLMQNVPNPLSDRTSIAYYLPASVKTSQLIITNIEGKKVYSVNLHNGNNSIEIDSSGWQRGLYSYTLIADGHSIDTKKMILE